MNQNDYWDSVAYDKNFTTVFQEKKFTQYVNKEAEILDVGCGYGRTLNQLYGLGYSNLTGVDSSVNMLNVVKEIIPI